MDTQVAITSLDELLHKPFVTNDEVLRMQTGTYDDIYHTLVEIQRKAQETNSNLNLNINELTYQVINGLPGMPLDQQEQFKAEQKQEFENLDFDRAFGGFAALGFATRKTSKDVDLAYGYDLKKKVDINKKIEEIVKTKDLEKVQELLQELRTENLLEDRKTTLLEDLKNAHLENADGVAQRIQLRHEELKAEREASPADSGNKRRKTESDAAYERFIRDVLERVPTMRDDDLELFLKNYTNKQLQGTHIHFQQLLLEKLEERKHFSFLLGKYKRQKWIVSVKDQNKIWEKKRGELLPILKNWQKDKKKLRSKSQTPSKEQKTAEQVKLDSYLQRILRHVRIWQRVTIETNYALEDSGENNSSGGISVVDGLNMGYGLFENVSGLFKKIQGLGGSGQAAGGLSGATAGESAAASTAGPIIIAVILALAVLVLIILIVSGGVGSGAVDSSLSGSGQSACPQETPSSTQEAVATLKQLFNITINGGDTNTINDIYNTTCKLSQYNFINLAHLSSKNDVTINIITDNSSCGEKVSSVGGGYKIDVHPCATSAGNEFLLSHEYGHIISFENTDLYDQWCTDVYNGTVNKNFPVDDARRCASSNPKTIPTYNCQLDYINHKEIPGPPYPQECFADMVGAFLTYKDFQDTVTQKDGTILPNNWQQMQDYPTNFPNYYNFAQTNLFGSSNPGTPISGQPTQCSGSVVTIPSITAKKLLPLCSNGTCFGRANYCMVPHYIVIHTTWSNDKDATSLYNYFASGSDGRGVGINFGIGPNGDVIQMAETLTDKVEVAWNVLNYQDDIGIELVHNNDYSSTNLPPTAQYEALMNLVMSLAAQYHIPVKDTTVNGVTYDCNWKSNTLDRVFAPSGVYGHYQFNTPTRSDPGQSFLCSFKKDLVSRLYPTKGLQ